jgi:hypothetical protein
MQGSHGTSSALLCHLGKCTRNLSHDSDQGHRMKLSQSSDPQLVPSKINKIHKMTFGNIIFTNTKISMDVVVIQNNRIATFCKCLQYVMRPCHYRLSLLIYISHPCWEEMPMLLRRKLNGPSNYITNIINQYL